MVPGPIDNEIMRGNDQRGLPASARHVVGIARDRILPIAVEPEKSSIDRPIVRGPGGRKRADECGVAFRENALTVPNASLKKEIAKPRPIASGSHFITLPEKISERISFDHHRTDAELVEQHPLRK